MTATAVAVACTSCGEPAELAEFCLPCAYRQPAARWTAAPFARAPVHALVGRTEPRLWTRPLRKLTPETSLGFECIAFATVVLGMELDPWQCWFLIHALELLDDGSFRFRTIVLLVARQQGKTTVMRALTLWSIFTGRVRLVVGTAQDLDVAKECWESAVDLVEADPELAAEIANPRGRARRANGQQELKLRNGCRYKIKATTVDAGRGIPGVGLLLADELRTHRDYGPWAALSKTALAVANALIVCMSNAGDDLSVVLNDLREKALAGLDETLGIFEWSGEPGCALDDRAAWAQACPSLGYGRVTERALKSSMLSDPPAVFRTEVLCQRVENMRGAVDRLAWAGGADPEGTLDGLRDQLHACLELAEGGFGEHATLVVAALRDDGAAVVEVAEAWTSYAEMERDLPGWLERLGVPVGPLPYKSEWLGRARCTTGDCARPLSAAVSFCCDPCGRVHGGQFGLVGAQIVHSPTCEARDAAMRVDPGGPEDTRPRSGPVGRWFFPTGPAAARASFLRDLGFEEIKGGHVSEACMGLAADIRAGRIVHRDDPLLTAHVCGAERLISGDGWRFTRKGAGNVDAAYAAAGAVWAARSGATEASDPRDSILWDHKD